MKKHLDRVKRKRRDCNHIATSHKSDPLRDEDISAGMSEDFKKQLGVCNVPNHVARKRHFLTIEAKSGPLRGMLWHSDATITTVGKYEGGSMIQVTDRKLNNRHSQVSDTCGEQVAFVEPSL